MILLLELTIIYFQEMTILLLADPVDLDVTIDPEESTRTVFTTVAGILSTG